MIDTTKQEQEEIEKLTENEQVFELDQLITDGAEAKIPITISYPQPNGEIVKAGAMIKPLTNVEWNNATRLKRKDNDTTTNEIELVKKALYTKDGEKFPPELVPKLPNGVIMELMKEVARVSGVELNNKENLKLVKELMGF